MSGLLLKDIFILKAGWKTYAFLMACYVVLSFTGNPTAYFFLLAVILMMCPVSSFTSDELARWEGFAAVLPGGRRAVVRAKYQLLLVLSGGFFLLFCLLNLAVALFKEDALPFWTLAVASFACCGVCLLINCVFYPLLFKYGSQKSRLILAAVFGTVFAVFAMAFLVLGTAGLDRLLEMPPVWLLAGAVVLLAASLGASYRLSCRIYEKREF